MKGLKELSRLDLEARRKQYPNVPDHALGSAKFSDKTANGLTKAIIRYLQLCGHTAWRQSSEGRYRPGVRVTDVLGRVRQMKGTFLPGQNNGASDVAALVNGRFFAIEVKMRDKQSDAQKDYQRRIELSGGVYIIARSFDDFLTQFNNL